MKPLDQVQQTTSKKIGTTLSVNHKYEYARIYWRDIVTGKITLGGSSTYDLTIIKEHG